MSVRYNWSLLACLGRLSSGRHLGLPRLRRRQWRQTRKQRSREKKEGRERRRRGCKRREDKIGEDSRINASRPTPICAVCMTYGLTAFPAVLCLWPHRTCRGVASGGRFVLKCLPDEGWSTSALPGGENMNWTAEKKFYLLPRIG